MKSLAARRGDIVNMVLRNRSMIEAVIPTRGLIGLNLSFLI